MSWDCYVVVECATQSSGSTRRVSSHTTSGCAQAHSRATSEQPERPAQEIEAKTSRSKDWSEQRPVERGCIATLDSEAALAPCFGHYARIGSMGNASRQHRVRETRVVRSDSVDDFDPKRKGHPATGRPFLQGRIVLTEG